MADSHLSTLAVLPPLIAPRWSSKRSSLPTHGGLDTKVAGMLGWRLHGWQQEGSDLAGEYDPRTGRPRFRTVGASVARQNGKTTWVVVRIARQLLPAKQTVAYTAQDRSLARMKWMEHVELLMDTPFANRVDRVERRNQQECLWMKNGSRYLPVTPSTKKAGRSLSIDLAIIDEAYAHESMGVIDALEPTLIARPMAQLWLLSNAGDEDSVLWWHYTELGRASVDDPDSDLCWIEYAPDDDADVLDPNGWRLANPGMGEPGGPDLLAMASAAKSTKEPTFRKEHLNLWVAKMASSGLPRQAWSACLRPGVVPGGRVAFGLDFDDERGTGALVSSGPVDDVDGGVVTPLEVIEVSTDLAALVERAAANAVKFNGWVVVHAGSPAASEIATLERLTGYGRKGKHRVMVLSTTEMARAVGSFHDATIARRLSHQDDPRLNAGVDQTGRRKVGDVFVWDRHGPLTAATLARWGALAPPPVVPSGKGSIGSPTSRQRTRPSSPLTQRRVPARR